MDINDIPQELLDKIKQQFNADPKIGELRVQQQMLQRSGKFQDALGIARTIEKLYNKCVYEYIKEAEKEVENIDVSDMDIPLADKEMMMQLLLSCFMCADMMKSAIIDIDDILHKYDKELHIEMFNDMRQLMEMSEQKLSFLQKNSGYLKDLVWGEKCDDMYELLLNKAGAIMRKRKNDPNWGNNTEKFNK